MNVRYHTTYCLIYFDIYAMIHLLMPAWCNDDFFTFTTTNSFTKINQLLLLSNYLQFFISHFTTATLCQQQCASLAKIYAQTHTQTIC